MRGGAGWIVIAGHAGGHAGDMLGTCSSHGSPPRRAHLPTACRPRAAHVPQESRESGLLRPVWLTSPIRGNVTSVR